MIQSKSLLPTLRSLLMEPNVPIVHRDLSWLQFNERVLFESQNQLNPLLERAKFLSITSTNIDEFFMIRISSVSRNLAQLVKNGNVKKASRLRKIRNNILETVNKFNVKQIESLDILGEILINEGIRIIRDLKQDEVIYKLGLKVFQENIFSKLSAPNFFSLNAIAQLENLQMAAVFKNMFVFVIPKSLPQCFLAEIKETGDHCVFFLDDLLMTYLGPAFRMDGSPGILRLTRDGDFTVDLEEEDTESIPDIVMSSVKTREKGKPVRVQYTGDMYIGVLDQLKKTMKLKSDEIMTASGSLCLGGLWSALNQLPNEIKIKKSLSYAPIEPVILDIFQNQENVFEIIKQRDILLHHPYDSFDCFVKWIEAACSDPKVTMIEQTIYRMDAVSPVIALLKKAAKKKKIKVLIELRARFDELNNLRLADELTKAGVDVAFGFGKLKLHAKVTLVTRKEKDEKGAEKIARYTHLSTGNYNATTARLYTDLAIITANADIGNDARIFFDGASAGETPSNFKTLISAPGRLYKVITNLIDKEIDMAKQGKPARVVAKVNALVDTGVIEKLYNASQAGVKIDLIVRGATSLVPGVKGLSENIRVISVVDRFLEHSRIYYFASSKKIYLSSADWMPRNFFSRLELAFPILDERLYEYIEKHVIYAYLNDTIKSRELTPQGTWKKRTSQSKAAKIRSQVYFEELAKKGYKNTPLERLS